MTLVLIAEDEMGIAHLLRDIFTDEGHEVVLASNGRQALELATETPPSLILTDFMMPIMDGAALINALAASPLLNAVPVIIMSSLPEEVIAQRCKGYTAFVAKPFNVFKLIDMVGALAQPGTAEPR